MRRRVWQSGARLVRSGLLGAAFALVVVLPAAEPVDTSASWLSRLQTELARREYHASENHSGLQAPNRVHRLRTYFTPNGIAVEDRHASAKLFELELAGFGRGARLQPVAAGSVASDGARVEIRRPGLIEWYENSTAGLEQGFTLETPPAGEGVLSLELRLRGASASAHGEDLVFATSAGRHLSYAKFVAKDAHGRPLPARFELASAQRIRLVVDDVAAAYPIDLDPLITASADTRITSGQPGGGLGVNVAGAGDVNGDGYGDVIVGFPLYDLGEEDEGVGVVFLGSATGVKNRFATPDGVFLESNQDGAQLGTSVARAGDVNRDGYGDVIVGAPFYDQGQTDEGAAFVFLGSANGVTFGSPETAAAQIESDQDENHASFQTAQLGTSVAGAGDVNGDGYSDVIVGAPGYNAPSRDEGAAFVFLGSATGIPSGGPSAAAAQLESDQQGAALGGSVAGAGDVNGDGFADVIAGAALYDDGQTDEGAGFVFLGSATGVADGDPGTSAAVLESDQPNARLGTSVAAAGDVDGDGFADVILGAPLYDAGQANEGAAFVFRGGAAGIADGTAATAATRLESDLAGAELGVSVSTAGDLDGDGYSDVFVGAPRYAAPLAEEGAAFVFLGSPAGIANATPTTAAIQIESDQAGAQLGASVAALGDLNGDGNADLAVGAPFDNGVFNDRGVALIFLDLIDANAAAELRPAASAASAGDVNGDGYDDVIIGAPGYTGSLQSAGAAFVFHGSATGIGAGDPSTAATQLEPDQAFAAFGTSVASAGDVNGDGYGDVIVGATAYAGFKGAAFVFHGSASGIPDGSIAAARLEGTSPSDFGFSVSGAGDVNGDGFDDVIVGARRHGGSDCFVGGACPGAAFIFLGSATGIPDSTPATAATRILAAWGHHEFLGESVDGAGDVNGDGYDDIIVGAPEYLLPPFFFVGAAFVYLGSSTGIPHGSPATADTQILPDEDFVGNIGDAVAGAGDVNADGYADVIVSGPADVIISSSPDALVFHGSASGIASGDPTTATDRLEVGKPAAIEGVDGIGDSNADGFDDVIVIGAGRAFVFAGSATGFGDATAHDAHAVVYGNEGILDLARGAGDVDDDGRADVVVGSDADGAMVFLAGSIRPPEFVARQTTFSGSPVEPWGSSPGGFRASLRQFRAGNGLVRGEVEACPSGLSFGSAGCTTALTPAWVAIDPGDEDLELAHAFTGLVDGALYRWRARLLYSPETAVIPPPDPIEGPWRRVQAQAVDSDIRVLPEPGFALALASGVALLASLHRWCRRS
jgi:hypothetical protein